MYNIYNNIEYYKNIIKSYQIIHDTIISTLQQSVQSLTNPTLSHTFSVIVGQVYSVTLTSNLNEELTKNMTKNNSEIKYQRDYLYKNNQILSQQILLLMSQLRLEQPASESLYNTSLQAVNIASYNKELCQAGMRSICFIYLCLCHLYIRHTCITY